MLPEDLHGSSILSQSPKLPTSPKANLMAPLTHGELGFRKNLPVTDSVADWRGGSTEPRDGANRVPCRGSGAGNHIKRDRGRGAQAVPLGGW